MGRRHSRRGSPRNSRLFSPCRGALGPSRFRRKGCSGQSKGSERSVQRRASATRLRLLRVQGGAPACAQGGRSLPLRGAASHHDARPARCYDPLLWSKSVLPQCCWAGMPDCHIRVGAAEALVVRPPGGRAARENDARREGRADDAARSKLPQIRFGYREILSGIGVERGRFRPQRRQQPRGLDQSDRPLSEARAGDAAVHSAALRRGRGAWAQQRSGRGYFSAKHRAGLHAQPDADREDRAHHGKRSARHRHQLGLRSLRHSAARHSLGTHL